MIETRTYGLSVDQNTIVAPELAYVAILVLHREGKQFDPNPDDDPATDRAFSHQVPEGKIVFLNPGSNPRDSQAEKISVTYKY